MMRLRWLCLTLICVILFAVQIEAQGGQRNDKKRQLLSELRSRMANLSRIYSRERLQFWRQRLRKTPEELKKIRKKFFASFMSRLTNLRKSWQERRKQVKMRRRQQGRRKSVPSPKRDPDWFMRQRGVKPLPKALHWLVCGKDSKTAACRRPRGGMERSAKAKWGDGSVHSNNGIVAPRIVAAKFGKRLVMKRQERGSGKGGFQWRRSFARGGQIARSSFANGGLIQPTLSKKSGRKGQKRLEGSDVVKVSWLQLLTAPALRKAANGSAVSPLWNPENETRNENTDSYDDLFPDEEDEDPNSKRDGWMEMGQNGTKPTNTTEQGQEEWDGEEEELQGWEGNWEEDVTDGDTNDDDDEWEEGIFLVGGSKNEEEESDGDEQEEDIAFAGGEVEEEGNEGEEEEEGYEDNGDDDEEEEEEEGYEDNGDDEEEEEEIMVGGSQDEEEEGEDDEYQDEDIAFAGGVVDDDEDEEEGQTGDRSQMDLNKLDASGWEYRIEDDMDSLRGELFNEKDILSEETDDDLEMGPIVDTEEGDVEDRGQLVAGSGQRWKQKMKMKLKLKKTKKRLLQKIKAMKKRKMEKKKKKGMMKKKGITTKCKVIRQRGKIVGKSCRSEWKGSGGGKRIKEWRVESRTEFGRRGNSNGRRSGYGWRRGEKWDRRGGIAQRRQWQRRDRMELPPPISAKQQWMARRGGWRRTKPSLLPDVEDAYPNP